MEKLLKIYLPIILILLGVLLWFTIPKTNQLGSTITQGPTLGTATTSTAVTVTSSTRLLATTTNALGTGTSYTRLYATICNPSTTLVYVSLNGDKPASLTSANTVIAASAGYDACFEITDRNPYNGSITASSTNQTSTSILVTDYVN